MITFGKEDREENNCDQEVGNPARVARSRTVWHRLATPTLTRSTQRTHPIPFPLKQSKRFDSWKTQINWSQPPEQQEKGLNKSPTTSQTAITRTGINIRQGGGQRIRGSWSPWIYGTFWSIEFEILKPPELKPSTASCVQVRGEDSQ